MENKEINLKLIDKHEETGNVKTFSFESNGLVWIPGQYQAYTLPGAGAEEKDNLRYFTIASAPSEKTIDISTRITDSSFKKTLESLNPGDSIQAHGLGGDFIWDEETKSPIILVAAGIGVTPYRSMLLEREAKWQSLDATLVYFNRNEEIPFLDTFKRLEKEHNEFKFLPIIGEHVSADRILELAPLAKDGTLYISGPAWMVEEIGGELKKENISIKQDWFPGYTEKNI